MFTRGAGGFQSAAAAAQNSVLGTGGAAHRCAGPSRWVEHGHHALVELEPFHAVGGYDESFSHNEDAELDVRLVKAQARIWLCQDLQVTYLPRSTASDLFRQYFNYGKGRARTLLQHGLRPRLRQQALVAVVPAALVAPLGVLEPALALPAVFWIAASLTMGVALAVRQRQWAVLASGPAAVVMHLAWSAGFWRQLVSTLGPKTDARRPIRQAAPT